MQNTKNKAFTLVELLVVITILAILSVTAYQSFWWATDKAQNTTKKSNVTLLSNTLWIFYTEENYYPMPQTKSDNNLWWYTWSYDATESDTIKVIYNKQEIQNIVKTETKWGWIIYWTWIWAKNGSTPTQIWAKWVLWVNWKFNKKYIKEKIYDTQVWDIRLTWLSDKKMIDFWIGKYVYALYARPSKISDNNWNVSWTRWTYYTLYATFKDLEWEWFETFLTWNYSQDNFTSTNNYPEDLLWLKLNQKDNNVETTNPNQWIPYPIDNFSE